MRGIDKKGVKGQKEMLPSRRRQMQFLVHGGYELPNPLFSDLRHREVAKLP